MLEDSIGCETSVEVGSNDFENVSLSTTAELEGVDIIVVEGELPLGLLFNTTTVELVIVVFNAFVVAAIVALTEIPGVFVLMKRVKF